MAEVVTAYEYKKLPIDSNGEIIKEQFRLKSPSGLVIISYPKMGKTLSMVNVPKIFIGDTLNEMDDYSFAYNHTKLTTHTGKAEFREISTGAYIPSGIYETVDELKRANNMAEFWRLKYMLDERRSVVEKSSIFEDLKACLNQMRYPIFAVDTVTFLQDLNYAAALAEYNQQVSVDKQKTDIRKVDKWGGAKYIRTNFSGIKMFIENNAAPFIIWTSHVKERKAVYEKSYESMAAVDMALEGIMSTTFTAAASAVGILYRKEEGVYLDFKKRDETDLGSRCSHLADRVIKLAEPRKDPYTIPVTHWDEIYPELSFA